jgi:hypothetical protein
VLYATSPQWTDEGGGTQAYAGQYFWAPPQEDSWAVYSAGATVYGFSPGAIYNNLAHFGTWDVQRSVPGCFISAYKSASNYNVGVYMQGAGYSPDDMNFIGGLYASLFASNAGDPSLPYWWGIGYQSAQTGQFAQPVGTATSLVSGGPSSDTGGPTIGPGGSGLT